MFSPFKKILVYKDIATGFNVIYWRFDKDIRYINNATLSLQYARTGGPWQILCPDIRDTCMYTDTRINNYNKVSNDNYRLVLSVSDNQCYVSDPQTVRWLDNPSYAKARNLFRLQYKQMAMTGRHGFLLKRIQWGQKCPLCAPMPGDNSVNQHCPQCLGTGFKGGYYKGIPVDILPDGQQQMQSIEEIGYTRSSVLQAKVVAWPYIGIGDVWVDAVTNQRYMIQQVTVISYFKSMPLLYQITMHLLEQTDALNSSEADQKVAQPPQQIPDWQKEFDDL